jgi:hypothetical protein
LIKNEIILLFHFLSICPFYNKINLCLDISLINIQMLEKLFINIKIINILILAYEVNIDKIDLELAFKNYHIEKFRIYETKFFTIFDNGRYIENLIQTNNHKIHTLNFLQDYDIKLLINK